MGIVHKPNIRHGLVGGQLPKGAGYIKRLTDQLRLTCETAVIAQRGEVSLIDAAAISSACRWERHALLAQRWLRRQFDELTPTERLNFSREVARASSERDKCLRALCLEAKHGDKNPLAYLEPMRAEAVASDDGDDCDGADVSANADTVQPRSGDSAEA